MPVLPRSASAAARRCEKERPTLCRTLSSTPLTIRDLSCEQAKLPYTTVYSESIGTTVEGVHFYYDGRSKWMMIITIR